MNADPRAWPVPPPTSVRDRWARLLGGAGEGPALLVGAGDAYGAALAALRFGSLALWDPGGAAPLAPAAHSLLDLAAPAGPRSLAPGDAAFPRVVLAGPATPGGLRAAARKVAPGGRLAWAGPSLPLPGGWQPARAHPHSPPGDPVWFARAPGMARPEGAPSPASPAASGDLVTFIVPTCNRAHLLPEALDSALAQRGARVEVIAVDDGSEDDTPRVLAAYGDRVHALRLPRNRGKSAALNLGMEHARGEWIVVLDDDDRAFPGQIAAQLAWASLHPGCGGVYGDSLRFHGGTGEAIGVQAALDVPPRWLCGQAALRIPFMPGTLLLRRAVQERIGPYREALRRGQDMDLFVRAAAAADLVPIPLAVQEVRVHAGVRGGGAHRFRAEEHHRRHLEVSAVPFGRLLATLDDSALVPAAARHPAWRGQAALHRAVSLCLRELWGEARAALAGFDPGEASPAAPVLLRHLAGLAAPAAAPPSPERLALLRRLRATLASLRPASPERRVLVVDEGGACALGRVVDAALAAEDAPPQVLIWARCRREPREPYAETCGAAFVDAPPDVPAGAVLARMAEGPWGRLELRSTAWPGDRALAWSRADFEGLGGFARSATTVEAALPRAPRPAPDAADAA
ncbi:glycosyltransferase family 2 protein [Myxococcota bacterium]|nr:glycosyltransferase family 2 protein [Myxococcota bacterium]